MIFRKKVAKLYHPQDIQAGGEWYICNALIGVKSYSSLGKPLCFDRSVSPDWYRELNDERQLERVWQAQDEYLKVLLRWLSAENVIEVFFDGAYEKNEKWFREKYPIREDGTGSWSSGMVEDLPRVNIHNVFLRTESGVLFIAYESWETLFVNLADISEFPVSLRKPTVQRTD